jgi:hypothetical protein
MFDDSNIYDFEFHLPGAKKDKKKKTVKEPNSTKHAVL